MGMWMILGFKFFSWKQLNLAFITKSYVTSGTSSDSMTIPSHIKLRTSWTQSTMSWIHKPLNSTQELRFLNCLPQSIWLLKQRIPLQKLLPVQLTHILRRLLSCIHLRLLTSFLDHMSQPILFMPNLPDSTIQLPHILQRLLHYRPLNLLTSFPDCMPWPILFMTSLPHMTHPHFKLTHITPSTTCLDLYWLITMPTTTSSNY